MKNEFSKDWKNSKKPSKQRKYRYNAPLHIRQKFARVHLSKELRNKYGRRNIGIKKGDKVTILRGQFKKKTGKVERVSLKKSEVFVAGIELIKKDGAKRQLPIEPSNLVITELNLDDKKRVKALERNKEKKK